MLSNDFGTLGQNQGAFVTTLGVNLSSLKDEARVKARAIGAFIEEKRRDKGWSRIPEFHAEILKYGAEISLGYYRKLESGEKSVASTSKQTQNAIRQALSLSPQQWEKGTGLAVPSDEELSQTTGSVTLIREYASSQEMFLGLEPSKKHGITQDFLNDLLRSNRVNVGQLFIVPADKQMWIANHHIANRQLKLYVAPVFVETSWRFYVYRTAFGLVLGTEPEDMSRLQKQNKLEVTRLEPTVKTQTITPDEHLEFVGAAIGASMFNLV